MSNSLLELRHLRTLVALKATGTISRAAQLLNVTQSALSHQVKILEDLYQASLFERKSSPIVFTAAGQHLLDLAHKVLPAVETAERDLARLAGHATGKLRIAVECHTCFDWLMPSMDALRERWPEVEQDIISGFQADPIGLLHQDRAELAIVSDLDEDETDMVFHPLFEFEMVALLPLNHPYLAKPYLEAADFAGQALITYPVPDEMLDLVRQVLKPAGVEPPRRTTELTVGMLQLVASGRGIATLPLWAVQGYLERGYVTARTVGATGLTGELHMACTAATSAQPWLRDFVQITRETCIRGLPGIDLL